MWTLSAYCVHRSSACRPPLGKPNLLLITSSPSPFWTTKFGSVTSRWVDIMDCYVWVLCLIILPVILIVRHMQIVEKDPLKPNGPPETSLVEIGPRFVLTPIRIFEGAFGGATVYSNPGMSLFRRQLSLVAIVLRLFSGSFADHYGTQNSSHLLQSVLQFVESKAASTVSASRQKKTLSDGKSTDYSTRMSWPSQKSSHNPLYITLITSQEDIPFFRISTDFLERQSSCGRQKAPHSSGE